MTSPTAVRAMIEALESLSIPYILVGSFSTSFYGIPRLSKDADFVVSLGEVSIRAVAERLGPAFTLDPQMSFESVTGTYRHNISMTVNAFLIEVFHLSDDPHDQERFRRRCRVTTPHGAAWLPTAEDVLVTKLRWAARIHRAKDIQDIRDVIQVQQDSLDWSYIQYWCDQHGSSELLTTLRSPPASS